MTSPTAFPPTNSQHVDVGVTGSTPADDTFALPHDTDLKLSVAPRDNANVDPDVVRLVNARAAKSSASPAHLHVEAWVKNMAYAKNVWIDAHLVSTDSQLIHRETYPLRYERAFGDGGDVFVLDSELFQGPVATQGTATPHPDVRYVELRLYAEMNGRVSTDGLVHRSQLPSAALAPRPSSRPAEESSTDILLIAAAAVAAYLIASHRS
jgi:hypothetical protein